MYKHTPDGIVLSVKVIPNAGFDEITGWEQGALKVRITSIPEKGKANQHLIKFLSKAFRVPKSKISLLKGETSRNKVLFFKEVAQLPLPPLDTVE